MFPESESRSRPRSVPAVPGPQQRLGYAHAHTPDSMPGGAMRARGRDIRRLLPRSPAPPPSEGRRRPGRERRPHFAPAAASRNPARGGGIRAADSDLGAGAATNGVMAGRHWPGGPGRQAVDRLGKAASRTCARERANALTHTHTHTHTGAAGRLSRERPARNRSPAAGA